MDYNKPMIGTDRGFFTTVEETISSLEGLSHEAMTKQLEDIQKSGHLALKVKGKGIAITYKNPDFDPAYVEKERVFTSKDVSPEPMNIKPVLEIKKLKDAISKEVDFILKDFVPIPRGTVTIITASGGTGKSFVSLQMGIRHTQAGGNAFLWLSEDETALTRKRTEQLFRDGVVRGNIDEVVEQLHTTDSIPPLFTKMNKGNQIETPDFQTVKEMLREYDLIILDPLIAFYGGNENDNGHARHFMNLFTEWARSEDKAIVFVHHSAKDKNNSRGASAIQDASRLVYAVSKITETKRVGEISVETIVEAEKRNLRFKVLKDNYNASRHCGNDFKRLVFPIPIKVENVSPTQGDF